MHICLALIIKLIWVMKLKIFHLPFQLLAIVLRKYSESHSCRMLFRLTQAKMLTMITIIVLIAQELTYSMRQISCEPTEYTMSIHT